METISNMPTPEAKPEIPKLPEGKFSFSNYSKERGAVLIKNDNGELAVSMAAPMEGQFSEGKKVTVKTAGGVEKDVLDINLVALSPQSTEGAALMHLQLDKDTLMRLLVIAAEQGILSKTESKWAPGGKMDQLTRFALDLDARLGK